MNLDSLKQKIEHFAREREWEQYHSPKNLSMALAVEAAELIEEFQWLTEKESRNLSEEKLQKVKDEIGDIFIYLLRISGVLDIDIIEAGHAKFKKNEIKYPVDKCKGSSRKYDEYK
ncbi:MAG TPA: nucleotide pyrophosphohydrolase [Lentisphaeria bacterium]|nr:MAG: nucleotide pyrophosphohydrolase [Lentisphaerae bacterium GWF2_38_69]HBM16086.1 nucleotide pyrophosphohydrolase [Lentisphaeria bacterium]